MHLRYGFSDFQGTLNEPMKPRGCCQGILEKLLIDGKFTTKSNNV